jgi:hypothetical protein
VAGYRAGATDFHLAPRFRIHRATVSLLLERQGSLDVTAPYPPFRSLTHESSTALVDPWPVSEDSLGPMRTQCVSLSVRLVYGMRGCHGNE